METYRSVGADRSRLEEGSPASGRPGYRARASASAFILSSNVSSSIRPPIHAAISRSSIVACIAVAVVVPAAAIAAAGPCAGGPSGRAPLIGGNAASNSPSSAGRALERGPDPGRLVLISSPEHRGGVAVSAGISGGLDTLLSTAATFRRVHLASLETISRTGASQQLGHHFGDTLGTRSLPRWSPRTRNPR